MFLLGQGWVIIFDLGPLQKFFKWPWTALKGVGPEAEGEGLGHFRAFPPTDPDWSRGGEALKVSASAFLPPKRTTSCSEELAVPSRYP